MIFLKYKFQKWNELRLVIFGTTFKSFISMEIHYV